MIYLLLFLNLNEGRTAQQIQTDGTMSKLT